MFPYSAPPSAGARLEDRAGTASRRRAAPGGVREVEVEARGRRSVPTRCPKHAPHGMRFARSSSFPSIWSKGPKSRIPAHPDQESAPGLPSQPDAWDLVEHAAERMEEQSPHSPAVHVLQMVLKWRGMNLAQDQQDLTPRQTLRWGSTSCWTGPTRSSIPRNRGGRGGASGPEREEPAQGGLFLVCDVQPVLIPCCTRVRSPRRRSSM